MPHQYQKEMLNLLQSFAGREVNDIDTERWILMINRGGLWQVNNQTYGFFVRLETEIRKHLTLTPNSELSSVTDAIIKNTDVQFDWCLLAAKADNAVANLVLQKIVQLYITVRGFSFAKSYIEIYKQAHRKTLQRSKALRSELSFNKH